MKLDDIRNRTDRIPGIGIFVCSCGHAKASHRPHGGRRVPLSAWICRKRDCDCQEYGANGVEVEWPAGPYVNDLTLGSESDDTGAGAP